MIKSIRVTGKPGKTVFPAELRWCFAVMRFQQTVQVGDIFHAHGECHLFQRQLRVSKKMQDLLKSSADPVITGRDLVPLKKRVAHTVTADSKFPAVIFQRF